MNNTDIYRATFNAVKTLYDDKSVLSRESIRKSQKPDGHAYHVVEFNGETLLQVVYTPRYSVSIIITDATVEDVKRYIADCSNELCDDFRYFLVTADSRVIYECPKNSSRDDAEFSQHYFLTRKDLKTDIVGAHGETAKSLSARAEIRFSSNA